MTWTDSSYKALRLVMILLSTSAVCISIFELCPVADKRDTVLDAPGNNAASSDKYVCQMCVSWPYRDAFFNKPSPTEIPETNEEKRQFIETIAKTWAEPFRTLAHSIPPNEEIKHLTPQDFAPPPDLRTTGRALLMGDALHAMAMCKCVHSSEIPDVRFYLKLTSVDRGEGANHAIVDVQDFVERVVPVLKENQPLNILRGALDAYEDEVIKRARPGVLASRRACLDAHEWSRINNRSPLLTRRERNTQFMEDS